MFNDAPTRLQTTAPIDWCAPWLAPYRRIGEPLATQLAAGVPMCTVLNAALELHRPAGGLPARFVAQAALPAGQAYEAFIARTGCVPTRDNAHDFFNALAWLVHPQLKARLNALQAAEIERDPAAALYRASDGAPGGAVADQVGGTRGGTARGAVRGPVQDGLTLFDENAAWLQAPPVLTDALQRRDWRALFLTHRARWCDATLVLFGHALLEKLLQPRKAITAHVWLVPWGVADAPAWLASTLTAQHLARKPWWPLPVLGVPGWWNLNQQAGFYDDGSVFRGAPVHLKTDSSCTKFNCAN